MWPKVVHKWSAAKSGRHNLQICPETGNTYYDVILHNLSRHEGLDKIPGALPFPNGLPTFLGLTRIFALLPGQLVLEYSILMSMTRKSFGSQLGSSTMISLLKKKWNAPWYSPRLAPSYMSASVHSMLPQFSETRKIFPSYLVSTPSLRRSNFIIHI